jgi:hypothetical protein
MNNSKIFETLQAKEDKLNAKLEIAREADNVASKAKDEALKQVYVKYFSDIETDLEDIQFGRTYGHSVEITARGDEYEKQVWDEEKDDYVTKKFWRTNEVANIKAKETSRWDDEKSDVHFTDLGMSVYSTSDNYSDFTINRMLFNGQVAMIIKDFKDDILAELNKVYEEQSEITKKTWKDVKDIRDQIDAIQDQRKNFKNDSIIEDLKSGIKILDDKTAYIQERFDEGTGGIVEAKITRMSYSGKSADLAVKTKGRRWDEKADAYVDCIYDRELTKVRVKNILDAFVSNYNGLTWERV